MIALNRYLPTPNLIITKVDTYIKNNGDYQYLLTPKKHNHSATEILDTNYKTTQVQIKVHPRLFQLSP